MTQEKESLPERRVLQESETGCCIYQITTVTHRRIINTSHFMCSKDDTTQANISRRNVRAEMCRMLHEEWNS
jgi:hypothetical protein